MIDDIICPIGLKEITSKQPAHEALSITDQLAVWHEAEFLNILKSKKIELKREIIKNKQSSVECY